MSDINLEDKNADEQIETLRAALLEFRFNCALGPSFAVALQIANNENIIKQYGLEDIRLLYNSLIEIEKQNLDLYLESAHFEWAVMDSESNAKSSDYSRAENCKSKSRRTYKADGRDR